MPIAKRREPLHTHKARTSKVTSDDETEAEIEAQHQRAEHERFEREWERIRGERNALAAQYRAIMANLTVEMEMRVLERLDNGAPVARGWERRQVDAITAVQNGNRDPVVVERYRLLHMMHREIRRYDDELLALARSVGPRALVDEKNAQDTKRRILLERGAKPDDVSKGSNRSDVYARRVQLHKWYSGTLEQLERRIATVRNLGFIPFELHRVFDGFVLWDVGAPFASKSDRDQAISELLARAEAEAERLRSIVRGLTPSRRGRPRRQP